MIDDGVVKYSLTFNENSQINLKEYKEIESCRERLFSLGLIGAYPNKIGYGNISLRHNKTDSFVITATQTGEYATLNENQYSFVDHIDFKTFSVTAQGLSKPSSESITHGAIYNLDSSINAVIHIHNEKLWNFMLENDFLSTNDTPYGTPQMVEDVIEMYKSRDILTHNIFVMKGHFEGIVCFGRTLKEAEYTLFELIKQLL